MDPANLTYQLPSINLTDHKEIGGQGDVKRKIKELEAKLKLI